MLALVLASVGLYGVLAYVTVAGVPCSHATSRRAALRKSVQCKPSASSERLYSIRVASLASTSSIMKSGTRSENRPPRSFRSSTLG